MLFVVLNGHPGVERANFKLWFICTSVLERVLHNAELCQTDFGVERISRKLPLFVQNEAFSRAADLLEDTQIAQTPLPQLSRSSGPRACLPLVAAAYSAAMLSARRFVVGAL